MVVPTSMLLNVGAGQGFLEEALAHTALSIESLDPTPDARHPDFIHTEFENAEFNHFFDCIVFSYSLHHFTNPSAAIAKAISLLKPSGKLLILEIAPRTHLEKVLLLDSRLLCSTTKNTWTENELSTLISKYGTVEITHHWNFFAPLYVVNPYAKT